MATMCFTKTTIEPWVSASFPMLSVKTIVRFRLSDPFLFHCHQRVILVNSTLLIYCVVYVVILKITTGSLP